MAETQEVEVLAIEKEDGTVYAIPLEALESFRVPDEDSSQLSSKGEAEAGDDEVGGYWWWGWGRPQPRPYRPAQNYNAGGWNIGNVWRGGGVIASGGGNVIASGGGN